MPLNILAAFIFLPLLLVTFKVIAQPTSTESFFGHKTGEKHLRYDQVTQYLKYLEQQSEQVKVMPYGQTYQGRTLNLVAVSSAQNLKNLDLIRIKHEQLNNPFATKVETQQQAVIIWLSYSAHGDEPSGAHAAIELIHTLSQNTNTEHNSWLDKAIILIDVVANPDGFDRYSNWLGTYASLHSTPDKQHIEHNESWPNSRGNHYWFDLNRDWLPLTQTESQQRISMYHKWKPNLLADFHEMQSDRGYFFQPGISSRTNPLTPKENQSITKQLTQYVADSFDKLGLLYFSEERFDDFYIGKASTYPDLQGGIGILLEQAESKGKVIETDSGPLSFGQTIQNHYTASLAIIKAAVEQANLLLDYQQDFFRTAIQQAKSDKHSGYLVTAHNQTRLKRFLETLNQHQIKAYALTQAFKAEDNEYPAEKSYWIPLVQGQYTMIKSIFSEQTEFADNTFYDVSNWNLALAHGIKYQAVTSRFFGVKAQPQAGYIEAEQTQSKLDETAYAWAFELDSPDSYPFLSELLKHKISTRVTEKLIKITTQKQALVLAPGTLIVIAGENSADSHALLSTLMDKYNLSYHSLHSGLTSYGPDLGSSNVTKLQQPRVAVVIGNQIKSTEIGEVWFQLDQKLKLPLSMLSIDKLLEFDLNRYSHLILVDGDYGKEIDEITSSIKPWLNKGGTLITFKQASLWASRNKLIHNDFLTSRDLEAPFKYQNYQYKDKESYFAQRRIAGSVFSTNLDLSHPISFGIKQAKLNIFKNDQSLLLESSMPFSSHGFYLESPLVAGYASPENISLVANTVSTAITKVQKGQVIAFSYNPLFRGYWHTSSRVFNNSLYFSPLINLNP
ncbi:M14 family zinc carboxypeptidase [Catenovulum maritimum]|uniref:M14 family zinc carboxypeptidase n=1 Tax=Catenovulum maritimum TaxID=1513271 RepID=UPI00065FB419|nr:M14 family zinc carboxypeptidase [Catenovulum maritimum]